MKHTVEISIELAERILATLRSDLGDIVHRMSREARMMGVSAEGFRADAIVREEIEKDINELANRITVVKLWIVTGR